MAGSRRTRLWSGSCARAYTINSIWNRWVVARNLCVCMHDMQWLRIMTPSCAGPVARLASGDVSRCSVSLQHAAHRFSGLSRLSKVVMTCVVDRGPGDHSLCQRDPASALWTD